MDNHLITNITSAPLSSDDAKITLFELAVKTRMDEIQLFMSRSNYFLVLQTALIFGVFSGRVSAPVVVTLLTIVGIGVSWLWMLAILGGRFWHARWERRVADLEQEMFGVQVQVFAATSDRIYADVRASIDWHGTHGFFRKNILNRLVLWKPSIANTMLSLAGIMIVFWSATMLHTLVICSKILCSVSLFFTK